MRHFAAHQQSSVVLPNEQSAAFERSHVRLLPSNNHSEPVVRNWAELILVRMFKFPFAADVRSAGGANLCALTFDFREQNLDFRLDGI